MKAGLLFSAVFCFFHGLVPAFAGPEDCGSSGCSKPAVTCEYTTDSGEQSAVVTLSDGREDRCTYSYDIPSTYSYARRQATSAKRVFNCAKLNSVLFAYASSDYGYINLAPRIDCRWRLPKN